MTLLAVETSCDETSAAVVEDCQSGDGAVHSGSQGGPACAVPFGYAVRADASGGGELSTGVQGRPATVIEGCQGLHGSVHSGDAEAVGPLTLTLANYLVRQRRKVCQARDPYCSCNHAAGARMTLARMRHNPSSRFGALHERLGAD